MAAYDTLDTPTGWWPQWISARFINPYRLILMAREFALKAEVRRMLIYCILFGWRYVQPDRCTDVDAYHLSHPPLQTTLVFGDAHDMVTGELRPGKSPFPLLLRLPV
jgi:hypothetical protein